MSGTSSLGQFTRFQAATNIQDEGDGIAYYHLMQNLNTLTIMILVLQFKSLMRWVLLEHSVCNSNLCHNFIFGCNMIYVSGSQAEFSDESFNTTSDEDSSALDSIFEAIVHQLSAEDFTIFCEEVLVQWVVVTNAV